MGGWWGFGGEGCPKGTSYTMKNTAPPRALRGQGSTGAEPPNEPLPIRHCGYSRIKKGRNPSGNRERTQGGKREPVRANGKRPERASATPRASRQKRAPEGRYRCGERSERGLRPDPFGATPRGVCRSPTRATGGARPPSYSEGERSPPEKHARP